jgi:bisphosphoglycerate-independent phosphoglycerate mutase (AlkP superfamily)
LIYIRFYKITRKPLAEQIVDATADKIAKVLNTTTAKTIETLKTNLNYLANTVQENPGKLVEDYQTGIAKLIVKNPNQKWTKETINKVITIPGSFPGGKCKTKRKL